MLKKFLNIKKENTSKRFKLKHFYKLHKEKNKEIM